MPIKPRERRATWKNNPQHELLLVEALLENENVQPYELLQQHPILASNYTHQQVYSKLHLIRNSPTSLESQKLDLEARKDGRAGAPRGMKHSRFAQTHHAKAKRLGASKLMARLRDCGIASDDDEDQYQERDEFGNDECADEDVEAEMANNIDSDDEDAFEMLDPTNLLSSPQRKVRRWDKKREDSDRGTASDMLSSPIFAAPAIQLPSALATERPSSDTLPSRPTEQNMLKTLSAETTHTCIKFNWAKGFGYAVLLLRNISPTQSISLGLGRGEMARRLTVTVTDNCNPFEILLSVGHVVQTQLSWVHSGPSIETEEFFVDLPEGVSGFPYKKEWFREQGMYVVFWAADCQGTPSSGLVTI